MKERPILFSGPMVRAILEGRKTQTRRVVKPQPHLGAPVFNAITPQSIYNPDESHEFATWEAFAREMSPYGQPGDRLWVRESFGYLDVASYRRDMDGAAFAVDLNNGKRAVVYQADPEYRKRFYTAHGKPSIHMPRWASRITLEIVSVRVERLHGISEADCASEGVGTQFLSGLYEFRASEYGIAEANFRQLWESINGPDSWSANPWVWVVEFKRIPTPTIDPEQPEGEEG